MPAGFVQFETRGYSALFFSNRFNDDNERIFEHLSDGMYWEKTHQLINKDRHGQDQKYAFLLKLYIDGVHLTKQGSFKASPVFVKAGMQFGLLVHFGLYITL